jgi:DNA-binding NtrC family response regulator
VDHDDSVLEAVGTILRGRDHRVETARGTREALALFETNDFDLVIADLQVSDGLSGHTLGEWLAEHRPALSRKLIWMSAVAPSTGAAEQFARNGCQFLQKPFKASDLLAAVDEQLLNKVHAAPIK